MHRILQSVKDLFIDFEKQNENIKNLALLHDDVSVDLSGFDIAIMGIAGTNRISGVNKIRREFYKLYLPENAKIIDLGNLIFVDYNSVFDFFQQIANDLLDKNLKLIIIGGEEKLTKQFFKIFKEKRQKITSLSIGSEIDFTYHENWEDKFFLNYLLENQGFVLSHYHVGYQNFLFDYRTEKKLHQAKIKKIRLSEARKDLLDIEPYFRASTLISFDLSAIKYSDCPATTNPQPNGFSGLEACELAYWIGMSENLKIFGIYEYNHLRDTDNISAKLSAQIIWHFIDAYYYKSNKKIDSNNNFNTFFVKIKQENKDLKLKFLQDKRTNLWSLLKEINDKEYVYYCSYKDFELAQKGKLSRRIKGILNL